MVNVLVIADPTCIERKQTFSVWSSHQGCVQQAVLVLLCQSAPLHKNEYQNGMSRPNKEYGFIY